MRITPLLGLIVIASSSCRFDRTVPDSASISCTSDGDCPDGRTCSPEVLRCIKVTGDKDAPSLLSFLLAPAVVSRTSKATLELVTNEVILGAPTFSITGFTQTTRVPENLGERFSFSYSAPPSSAEGSLEPRVLLIDVSGNQSDLSLGSLRHDFTPPAVVPGSVTVRPELARPGENVLVQIAFTEPLGETPLLSLSGAQAVPALSGAGAFASFQLPIAATTPDGTLPLELSAIVDFAGNRSEASTVGTLRVDTHQPRITTLSIVGGASVFSVKPGHDTFTVVAEGDVGTDDTLRSLDVSFAGTLLTCTSPAPTRRECQVKVEATMPEGEAIIQAVATDAAGNSAGKSLVVRLDFTPPSIVSSSLLATFTPGPTSSALQVSALGLAARVDVGFSSTELLGQAPQVMLGTVSLPCTSAALSHTCPYIHDCAALADGPHEAQITLVDAVGNTFTSAPGLLVVPSDCQAPAAPDVTTPGTVLWQRAPYGSTWSPGQVGTRLVVAATVINEPKLTLLVGNALGSGQLEPIASGPVGSAIGATTLVPGLAIDRVRVSVQAVDAAGNASTVVPVRENEVTVAFGGTASAPVLRRGLANDDLHLGGLGEPLSSPFVGAVVNARPLVSPLGRGGPVISGVGNGKLLYFGGAPLFSATYDDTWVFDSDALSWSPVEGTHPQGRASARSAALGGGKTLVFGGVGVAPVADAWVHDLASNTWATTTGLQPPGRSEFELASLGDGRALAFGGRGASGPMNDSWLFDVTTNTWADITVSAGALPARAGHQLTSLGDGTLLLTGGVQANGSLGEPYLFDIATLQWSKLSLPMNVVKRVSRNGHSAVQAGVGRAVLVGGSIDGGSVDGGVYDTAAMYDAPSKTFFFSPGTQPQPVTSVGLSYLGGGHVLQVGGVTPNGALYVADTSVFDTTSRTWSISPGGVPPNFAGPSVVSIEPGTAIMLPSGFFGNEVWQFSDSTRRWAPAFGADPYLPIFGARASLLDGRLFQFGADFSSVSQTVTFSAAQPVWVQADGGQPTYRTDALASDLGNGKLLLFGGVSSVALKDSWRLDLGTLDWQQVTGVTTPPTGAGKRLTRLGVGRALLTDAAFAHWVFDDATGQWAAAPAGPSTRTAYVTASVGADLLLFGGVSGSTALQDTWLFIGTSRTWLSVASTLTTEAPLGLIALSTGDVLLNTASAAYVFSKTAHTWAPTTGYPAQSQSSAMALGDRAIVLRANPSDPMAPFEIWAFDVPSKTWSRLAQKVPAGAYTVYPMATRAFAQPAVRATGSILFSETGEASTGLGSVSLAQLGVLPSEVQGLKAAATAGANGYTAAGAPLDGVDLQLYATSDTGRLFQTCASGSGTAASPTAVSCPLATFTARSSVAFRVKPKGTSNMRPVGLTVENAALEVRYR